MSVTVGDKAPDFRLRDQDGKEVSLADFRGKKAVVLYFYPKDQSPVCTKEACGFRDSYEDFVTAGAEVIGVSGGSAGQHKSFAEHHHLPFTLLADEGNRVRRAYGVPPTLWILPGRVTYVIDKSGVVRHVFDSQFQAIKHIEEALGVVKALASQVQAIKHDETLHGAGGGREMTKRVGAVIVSLVVLDASTALAQNSKYPPLKEYLMTREAEIALARSAAPESVSGRATIKVLTAKGYVAATQGDNGFVCLVERGFAAPSFTPPPVR
jgi:peroxiredoxin Q/BCP